MSSGSNNIPQVRRLCHQLYFTSCVEDKRRGRDVELLRLPTPLVRFEEEQIVKIDQGERAPFDISLPLPAQDTREGSTQGARLFWERFQLVARRGEDAAHTPGAGLYLRRGFERIAARGGEKLKALCPDMKRHCRHGC